jgi:hypothetical protein
MRIFLFLSLSFFSVSVFSQSVMDFEWDESTWKSDTPWRYIAEKDARCLNHPAPYGGLCNEEKGHRFFIYSENNPSRAVASHRYGVMLPGQFKGKTGDALGLVFTSGIGKGEDGNDALFGQKVETLDELRELEADPWAYNVYADRRLPGAASLYYKPLDNYDTSLGIFKGANRFSLYIWQPADPERFRRYSKRERGIPVAPNKTLEWYPFIGGQDRGHYYHYTTNRPAGGWMHVMFDAHPTHHNVGPYEERHEFREGGFDYPGDGVAYFENIAAFALKFRSMENKPSPYYILTDDWKGVYVDGENEETIANLGVGYDPSGRNFDFSLEDKFRCIECSGKYEIKYSFSPIDNSNFTDAKSLTDLENYYIEDDNDSHYLIKPHGGYNRVWGRFFIAQSDVERFLSGERIYFAVKDRSERPFLMSSHDKAAYLKVKTISLDYIAPPDMPKVHSPGDVIVQEQMETAAYFPLDDGIQEVNREAPYEIRHMLREMNYGDVKLTFDAFEIGTFDLQFLSKSAKSERPVTSFSKVTVVDTLCGFGSECFYTPIADFSLETPLRYSQFINHKAVKGERRGGAFYVDQGGVLSVFGSGLNANPSDVIKITVKNPKGFGQFAKIAISGVHEIPPVKNHWGGWSIPNEKWLNPGESVDFLIPVQQLSKSQLTRVTVSPLNEGIDIERIAIERIAPVECAECETVLVDFFVTDVDHLTPQATWSEVLLAPYTRKVEDGVGIVVGSNRNYNFQGVKGESVFLDRDVANVHWYNAGTKTYTFTPLYSFDDVDTPKFGVQGSWFDIGPITLNPGQGYIQKVPGLKGKKVFNSNVNMDQNRSITVRKITVE